jgi:mannosyltransferase OCH1-like enzyme
MTSCRHGGVYLDTDTIALRPIDDLIEGDAPFGVCELPMSRWGMRYEEHCRFMCNGIMGTPPGEEMFKIAFETSQANVKLENPKMKVITSMEVPGPGFRAGHC